MPPPLLLHVFPSFETGGAQARTVTLMNALAGRFRHAVAALNGDFSSGARIAADVEWLPLEFEPSRNPIASARRFRGLLRAVRPDLLLTYNWGAIDALLALLPSRLCPAVHVEDGFGPDEAHALKARRVWTRRLVLPRTAHALAVPSGTLLTIARDRYRLPERRLRYIPNGVDIERFRPGANSALRAALGIPAGATVFGTAGRLRGEKDYPWLVRRFAEAALPEARLVLVGDGPERAAIAAEVRARGVEAQVVFAGETADPAPFYGVFDVFVLSSATEQMPMTLLEAMASGLPALCTDAGDIRAMLPPAHAALAVARTEPEADVRQLQQLAGDPDYRAVLGAANRARATAEFSLDLMVGRWERLYLEAAGMAPPPQHEHQHVP
jgi:glycosyltransferase involved in cell wall biosynthesis